MLTNGLSSSLKEMTGALPQGLLCPVLFNVYINDLDEGMERMFIKSAHDSKHRGIANTFYDRIRIQNDLNRLEKWANTNKMSFKKINKKVVTTKEATHKWEIEGRKEERQWGWSRGRE